MPVETSGPAGEFVRALEEALGGAARFAGRVTLAAQAAAAR